MSTGQEQERDSEIEVSDDERIAALQHEIDAAHARKSAKSAVNRAQAVVHKSVPLDTESGEWEYTVRNGDVLRFPGGVHKVDS